MSIIFSLQGPRNCGKTSTLIRLSSQIQASYRALAVPLIGFRGNDICVTIDITIKGKKIRVGIASQGDARTHIVKNLNPLINAGCNIIFCACRTGGGTVNQLRSYTPAWRVVMVQKRKEPSKRLHSLGNNRMALFLMHLAQI